MVKTYTVLVEFAGGTYLSQFKASTPKQALARWTEASTRVTGVPKKLREVMKKQLGFGDEPVAIRGLKNVWCISEEHENKLALIHIIQTGS